MPSPPTPRPLIVTDDPRILEELLRLAAAADVDPVVAHAVAHACRDWPDSPLVVVGADLAAGMAARAPHRHPNLVVAAYAPRSQAPGSESDLWREAVRLGAHDVLSLPEAETRLVDLFTAVAVGPPRKQAIIGVVGGRGGVGASLLAVALALAGVRARLRTLLVDSDPLGGGLDLLLGQEHVPGTRWHDLVARQGRMAPAALWSALPAVSGLALLTWEHSSDSPVPVPAVAMRSILASAAEVDLLVADLPRVLDGPAREVVQRAWSVLLLVPADVHSVVAATRVAAALREHTSKGGIVIRSSTPPRLSPEVVATSTGLPLAGELAVEPGLDRLLERGAVPATHRKSPLRRFSDAFVAGLRTTEGGAL